MLLPTSSWLLWAQEESQTWPPIERKITSLDLARNHLFVPVAVETTGSFDEDTIAFLHELANRIRSQTHDPLQYIKLCQRLSICVQNFNCASIMGCCTLI
jgi:hypothetical protein